MFPFVLLGRIYTIFTNRETDYDLVFFYTTYGIGGAERVNAEILNAVLDKKVLVIFTKKSSNNGMRDFLIRPEFDSVDISKWTDDKRIYFMSFVFRGIYAQLIKQQKSAQVFIAQSNFGYKTLPHLPRDTRVTELIHMHDDKFLWVWAPFIKFIDKRVLVGDVFKDKFSRVYSKYGIPDKYTQRFVVIRYCLEFIPDELTTRDFDLPLKFYYAGRGGPQKRLWILKAVIKKCRDENLPIEFKLAGSFEDEMPRNLIEDGTYVGELKGGNAMYQFHKENDVLIMTSAFEGFPIVIMEAMAFGSVVLAPAIDAIPENIKHNQSGFLINEVQKEEVMIDELMIQIKEIINNRQRLTQVSTSAFQMLHKRFTRALFIKNYRSLFLFD